MRGILVTIGSALYSFPDKKAVLAFLADYTKSGKPDLTVDAKAHGATFEGRAPWRAETIRECRDLFQIMSLDHS